LARNGIIHGELGQTLSRMAGFLNVLVHGYDEVDLDVVRDVLERRLDDLEAFVEAVRSAHAE
jgi:uncharacterized protein YutE (UPF0331/DUF86 family)